jgi:hypothetical protein
MTFPAVASTPQIIIPSNNLRNTLGFNAGTYPAAMQATTYTKLSDFTPQITPIQSLLINTDLVANSYNIPSGILYTFSPSGTVFGGLIVSTPNEYFFVDVSDGNYSQFNIEFLDQNYNKVKIRDSNIIVQLLFKVLKTSR